LHFFNPAPLMALVEIVPALQSSSDIVEECYELMKAWQKIPVLAKDTPGFIVNRLARPFYGEALRIHEEGIADPATIDWAMTELGGFRMGPFSLMDYIGHDVNFKVTETVFSAFYYDPRYRPSFTQQRLVDAGFLGRKSGRGFYNYQKGATKPEPKREEALGQKIVDRIRLMLINEAADALFLKIATREDLDLAMTKGVNYPKGLLAWADELGINRVVEGLDDLYHEYLEDRYRCSPLLRRMSRNEETFF
jgi:3-hydroxybutyryl-CoA dehydrogenase